MLSEDQRTELAVTRALGRWRMDLEALEVGDPVWIDNPEYGPPTLQVVTKRTPRRVTVEVSPGGRAAVFSIYSRYGRLLEAGSSLHNTPEEVRPVNRVTIRWAEERMYPQAEYHARAYNAELIRLATERLPRACEKPSTGSHVMARALLKLEGLVADLEATEAMTDFWVDRRWPEEQGAQDNA